MSKRPAAPGSVDVTEVFRSAHRWTQVSLRAGGLVPRSAPRPRGKRAQDALPCGPWTGQTRGCPSFCPLRSFLLCDNAVPRWMRKPAPLDGILPRTSSQRAARSHRLAPGLPWGHQLSFQSSGEAGSSRPAWGGRGGLGADLATLRGPLPSGGICAQLTHPNLTTPNLASGGTPRRSS